MVRGRARGVGRLAVESLSHEAIDPIGDGQIGLPRCVRVSVENLGYLVQYGRSSVIRENRNMADRGYSLHDLFTGDLVIMDELGAFEG